MDYEIKSFIYHFIVFEAHHAHIINTFIENTMLAFTTTRSTALPFQKTIKTLKKTREKAAYANKYTENDNNDFALAEDEDEFIVDDGKEDEDDDQAFIDSFERDGSATSSSSSSTCSLRVKSIDA